MSARSGVAALSIAGMAALFLSGCIAGEGGGQREPANMGGSNASGSSWSADTLTLDWATYNPLSLIVKDQGWLENTLDGVKVTWVQSAGSNKANEALRAGAIDVGSTAGSAALLARANGSPIKSIDVYDQPEWAALVVSAGSKISTVQDLRGKSIAVTRGTDPYFFLLQALEANGLNVGDVEIQNLQHGDGRSALEGGSVDAWSGLDPLIGASQVDANSTLLYRNIDFNTYGLLNAREDFLKDHPDVAQAVVDAYEKARKFAEDNPKQTVALLSEAAGITPEIAKLVIEERTVFEVDPAPGKAQEKVLKTIAPVLIESGDVAGKAQVDRAVETLFESSFARNAQPSRVKD